MDMQTILKQQV